MKIFFVLFLIAGIILGQTDTLKFSGNLRIDSQIALHEVIKINSDESGKSPVNKKSPFLAGLMSFAVPGAGEFYAESYLKSAIFLALEATAITVGLIYDGKGDDQTNVFENYAHGHWDVSKYARWTFDNLDHLENKIGTVVDRDKYAGLFINEERTKVNWQLLNELESDIGGWYSHRLEVFGEQQYYEMIGKYPQFNPGWDDFDESSLYTYTNQERNPVTQHFDYYSGLRGKANDYFNIASTAVIVVIVNHAISAIDAAWTTSRYNKNLNLNMSIEKQQVGYITDYHPKLNLSLNF